MKNRFLNVVPRAVQVWAVAIVAAAVLIGLAVGCYGGAYAPVQICLCMPQAPWPSAS